MADPAGPARGPARVRKDITRGVPRVLLHNDAQMSRPSPPAPSRLPAAPARHPAPCRLLPRPRRVLFLLALAGSAGVGRPVYAATPATPASVAGAPLATATLDLDGDGDGKPDTLALSAGGELTVTTGARPALQVFPPASQLRTAVLSLKTAGASGSPERYVFVEAQTAGGRLLGVVAVTGKGLRTAYAGPVGPIGRDGEYALTVAAAPAGLLRYQTAPGNARCDGEDRLFVEKYAADGGWQPAPALTLESLRAAAPGSVTATAPAGLAPRPIGVYRFTAASAQPGVQRADLLTPPRELEDGQAATVWQIPGDAHGAFVTARATGTGHQIHAVRIEAPRPAPGGTSPGTLPRQVALTFEPGSTAPLLLDLPGTGGVHWVRLAQPVKSRCVSVVVTGPAEVQHAALGEVAIYSELDAKPADATLPQLVILAATGGSAEADAALRTLLSLVEQRDAGRARAMADAIGAELPKATGAGRRRLHALLGALAPVSGAALGGVLPPLVVRALALAPAGERPPLWRTLEQLGPGALVAVERLAQDPSQPKGLRADLLARLGERPEAEAVPILLALVPAAATERELRPGVVTGLSGTLRCKPASAPGLAAVAALSKAPAGTPAERAVVVEALGRACGGCEDAGARAACADTLVAAWPPAPASPSPLDAGPVFELRLRVLQGLLRIATVTEPGLRLLQEVLASDPEPVLRQHASRVATALPRTPATDALVRKALSDGDAGVRLVTLSTLGLRDDAATRQATEKLAAGDAWPLVRRTALEAAAAQCTPGGGSNQVLRAALADGDEQVQRLGLAGLGRCEGAGALDLYTSVLRRADAAPALRGQACALLARHGFAPSPALSDARRAQAHKDLGDALLDLQEEPEADERHAATLQGCLRALGELGDARDGDVLARTAANELPATLRTTALESLGRLCTRTRAPLSAGARKLLTEVVRSTADAAKPTAPATKDKARAGTPENSEPGAPNLRAAAARTAAQCGTAPAPSGKP